MPDTRDSLDCKTPSTRRYARNWRPTHLVNGRSYPMKGWSASTNPTARPPKSRSVKGGEISGHRGVANGGYELVPIPDPPACDVPHPSQAAVA